MGDIRTMQDIETAIEQLTTQECAELRSWLDQYDQPQPIDLQLEADLASGKIDERIRRAAADYRAGITQSLPDRRG